MELINLPIKEVAADTAKPINSPLPIDFTTFKALVMAIFAFVAAVFFIISTVSAAFDMVDAFVEFASC